MNTRKTKASEVLKRPALPKLRKGPPIRASELVQRRAAEEQKAFERAVDRREKLLLQLTRVQAAVWTSARRVKAYEKKLV